MNCVNYICIDIILKVAEMIKEADVNGDGVISYEGMFYENICCCDNAYNYKCSNLMRWKIFWLHCNCNLMQHQSWRLQLLGTYQYQSLQILDTYQSL